MPGENRTLTPVWTAYVDGRRLGTGYEGALKRIRIHEQTGKRDKIRIVRAQDARRHNQEHSVSV